MIRIFRTVFFVCVVSVLWTGFVPATEEVEKGQSTAPVIVVEEPTYDFGQVSQGQVVTHDFRVLNQGTAPLMIKGVKPG